MHTDKKNWQQIQNSTTLDYAVSLLLGFIFLIVLINVFTP